MAEVAGAAGFEAQFAGMETVRVTMPRAHVAEVMLARPKKSNAMNQLMWKELREAFQTISAGQTVEEAESDPADVRVVVFGGEGRSFCAGLDLMDHVGLFTAAPDADVGRRAVLLRSMIVDYQETVNAVARCPFPVVSAVQGACVGAGLDLVCATDIRLATGDASFSLREVDVGIAADVGVLQRLPPIIGDGATRELAFTARNMPAGEAMERGLVFKVLPDAKALHTEAYALADKIAVHSPLAVQGTKEALNFNNDRVISTSLVYQQAWNAAHLQGSDLMTAAQAKMAGQTPQFAPVPRRLQNKQ